MITNTKLLIDDKEGLIGHYIKVNEGSYSGNGEGILIRMNGGAWLSTNRGEMYIQYPTSLIHLRHKCLACK